MSVLLNEIPFGGYHGFLDAITEIVGRHLPDNAQLMAKLECKPPPSTEFGVNGLGMCGADFRTLIEELCAREHVPKLDADSSITIGSLLNFFLSAKHHKERIALNTQLSVIQRNA